MSAGREFCYSAAWGGESAGPGAEKLGSSSDFYFIYLNHLGKVMLGFCLFIHLVIIMTSYRAALRKRQLESALLTAQPQANISYDYSIMLLPKKQGGQECRLAPKSDFPVIATSRLCKAQRSTFSMTAFSRPHGGDSASYRGAVKGRLLTAQKPRTMWGRQLFSVGGWPTKLSVLFCLHLKTVEHMKQISPCT